MLHVQFVCVYMYSEHPCTWNKSSKPFISSSIIVTCIISIECEKGVIVLRFISLNVITIIYIRGRPLLF